MIRASLLGCCCAAAVTGMMTFGDTLLSGVSAKSQTGTSGDLASRSILTPLLPIPILRSGRLDAILFLRIALFFPQNSSSLPDNIVTNLLTDSAYHIVMGRQIEITDGDTIEAEPLRQALMAALKPHLSDGTRILIDQLNVRKLEAVR